MSETEPESVPEEITETVAPGAVVEPLEPVIERIDRLETAVMGKLDELAGASHSHPDPVEDKDETPFRKPWTHRSPFDRGE